MFANTKLKRKQEQLAPTKTYFNEMIMIDTKGPIYPTSEGNNYIFVNNAHYAFTALFEHWFMKFRLPEEIRSDNASEYIITELTHSCNYFEIKFKPSTTYAPWTNGLVEGTNRKIGKFIGTLLNEKYNNWSRKAKFFPYAYNTQYQTRLGMSPYKVVFSQKPRKPTKIKLRTTSDEMGNCNPSDKSACKSASDKNRENQQKLNSEQHRMKWVIATHRIKVHVTHNLHVHTWKTISAILKLQNYKKEHSQNGS